ncbi:MAG: UDP-glucose/GDP-mannose dehydrogenase family protein [Deltaproteobacteria bacterium]|nr:UDP-glucose/GDP-mannose dehydrogenase family protein [Deltaproteobacteria bacterium]
MRLCVVGTGYVGLVAGAGFAEFGNTVTCADIDEAKIARLNRGEIPIYEPGLEKLVQRNAAEGRLVFTTDVTAAARDAEVIFLAVGTPMAEDGRADLSQMYSAGRMVAKGLNRFTVVVIKSTVPVGTSEEMTRVMSELTEMKFTVASNPEFLKEGDAVSDFMKPDRVILGTTHPKAAEVLRYLYAPFVRTNDRIHMMDPRSAELTKYASNAFLATRISFINEISNLCTSMGADVEMVRRGMGADPRIGPKFLFPGVGYGGSCFPKDVAALIHMGQQQDVPLDIVTATDRVNRRQKVLLVSQAMDYHGGDIEQKRFALWGLAFKPHTDDVREAPALVVVRRLLDAGATVRAFDPVAGPAFVRAFGSADGFELAQSPYDAVDGAHGLMLCTEWPEFRRPDFRRVAGLMADRAVFDGRNIWSPGMLASWGFTYYGVGRPVRRPEVGEADQESNTAS